MYYALRESCLSENPVTYFFDSCIRLFSYCMNSSIIEEFSEYDPKYGHIKIMV